MDNLENGKSTIESNNSQTEEAKRLLEQIQKAQSKADQQWYSFKEFFIAWFVLTIVVLIGYFYFNPDTHLSTLCLLFFLFFVGGGIIAGIILILIFKLISKY